MILPLYIGITEFETWSNDLTCQFCLTILRVSRLNHVINLRHILTLYGVLMATNEGWHMGD